MPSFPFAPRIARLLLAMIVISVVTLRDAATAQTVDLSPTDTTSPRSTLQGFIDSCNEVYGSIERDRFIRRDHPEQRIIVRRILDCLDDSQLPEYAREYRSAEVATCIKEILDRVEIPPWDEIPDADEISEQEDGLDRWQVPGTRLTIARIEDGPRKHEYLFTAGTVGRAIEYYDDVKPMAYRQSGPETSPNFHRWYLTSAGGPRIGRFVSMLPEWVRARTMGLAIWKWFALVLSIIISALLIVLMYSLQRKYAKKHTADHPVLYCFSAIFPLIAVMIPLLFRYTVINAVSLRGDWLYAVSFGANIVMLIISLSLVFSVVNCVTALILSSPKINPQGLDAQFIRIVSKIIALSLCVLVFLEIGQYLGIPVTTLLASAGVGGLAVALAAQDTVKNLFGTIMLMADKPFRVGERIQVATYDGVVEDIGLRSTRIRLLTGHQVTIPNDTLARGDIENIGRRPYIRRSSSIHFPLDTARDKIERALEIVRDSLRDHEGMSEKYPPRVFFDEFNDDSFNMKIVYWYHPANYWDFLAFSEKLNLEIMRLFEKEDISFSLPTRVARTNIDGLERSAAHIVNDEP
ncbi:MAG: mechanosensitive ion channel family protein [Rubripirellula sp.]